MLIHFCMHDNITTERSTQCHRRAKKCKDFPCRKILATDGDDSRVQDGIACHGHRGLPKSNPAYKKSSKYRQADDTNISVVARRLFLLELANDAIYREKAKSNNAWMGEAISIEL